MARKSPAFSFYPDSWRGGVALMSPLERAAYIDLLSITWLHGGITRQQAYRVCMDIDQESVDAVLESKFECGKDGLFRNLRLEEERGKQQKRSENGKQGGRPKKQMESKAKANPEANEKLNESKTESKTKHSDSDSDSDSVSETVSDSGSETNTASPPGGDGRFDRFWETVHHKVGKQAARREFDRAVKRKAKQMLSPADAAEFIIDAMGEFARSPAARPRDHTPIHPATWLSQGRYDDDRSAWHRQQTETRKKEMVRL